MKNGLAIVVSIVFLASCTSTSTSPEKYTKTWVENIDIISTPEGFGPNCKTVLDRKIFSYFGNSGEFNEKYSEQLNQWDRNGRQFTHTTPTVSYYNDSGSFDVTFKVKEGSSRHHHELSIYYGYDDNGKLHRSIRYLVPDLYSDEYLSVIKPIIDKVDDGFMKRMNVVYKNQADFAMGKVPHTIFVGGDIPSNIKDEIVTSYKNTQGVDRMNCDATDWPSFEQKVRLNFNNANPYKNIVFKFPCFKCAEYKGISDNYYNYLKGNNFSNNDLSIEFIKLDRYGSASIVVGNKTNSFITIIDVIEHANSSVSRELSKLLKGKKIPPQTVLTFKSDHSLYDSGELIQQIGDNLTYKLFLEYSLKTEVRNFVGVVNRGKASPIRK